MNTFLGRVKSSGDYDTAKMKVFEFKEAGQLNYNINSN